MSGVACEEEAALLQKVLSQFRGGIDFGLFWNLFISSSPYLCDKCQSLLKRQQSQEAEPAKTNADITANCAVLFNARGNVPPPPPERVSTGNKRSRETSPVPAITPTRSSSQSDSVDVSVMADYKYLV